MEPALRPPVLLRLRSSTAYISLTVGLGILVDLSGYGLVVPVIPFRLVELGYPIDSSGALVGYLVAAYAAGLIISSPPIAWAGEKVKGRRMPLVVALLFMAGALVLFMLTESYALLVVSRFLQGISGTGIWTLGLSLITDSVPEERIGSVMGFVMLGFSLGSLIGPPVGGVLYARLGYRAPFIFALILVFFDLMLRLFVIEKHVALEWIAKGVDIPGFEAPGYTPPPSVDQASVGLNAVSSSTTIVSPDLVGGGKEVVLEGEEEVKVPSVKKALLHMITAPRPVTLFLLTLLNGIVLGGLLDTGMVLWLQYEYGLDSLGSGLVFIGAVAPSFFASPLAGWACDKLGSKWIAVFGVMLSIPSYSLLIIPGPLPLFVFFLVLVGTSLSLFLLPVMTDLSVVVGATPGLGPSHVYGTFNMAFSVGAFVGPLAGGQIIRAVNIQKGWIILAALCSVLAALMLPLVVLYVGGPLERKKDVGAVEASLERAETEVEK